MSQNVIDIVAKLQVQGLDAVSRQINAALTNKTVGVDVAVSQGSQAAITNLNKSLDLLNNTLLRVNAQSSSATSSLRGMGSGATSVANSFQQMSASGASVSATMRSVSRSFAQAENSLNSFSFQTGLAARRFAAFTIGAGALIKLSQYFREGISEGISFQNQLVKIAQVSGDSEGKLKALAGEVTALATAYGVSSRDLTKAALTLKQAGLTAKDTGIALEALAKAALAPNFDSMTQTAEGAIAVMAQFKISASGLEGALGSMNAVAGEFAVEASDLITLVQKAGGTFKAAGGDLNELLGLFTSVRATTRESADQIATGLRTIFGRLQNNNVVESLKDMQIELRYTAEEARKLGDPKLTNQFVGAFEAFRRISAGAANIPTTDPKFAALVETIGGSRQLSRVIPAIREFGLAQKAVQVAQAGGISLNIATEKSQQSLQVQIDKTREKFLELFRSITNDKTFDGILRTVLKTTDALIDMTSALKPVLPLLAGIAGAAGIRSITSGTLFGAASFLGRGVLSGGAHRYATGDLVKGPGNDDNQLALVTPGEFIFSRTAVQRIGVDRLRELHERGKANQVGPRRYATGGEVPGWSHIEGDAPSSFSLNADTLNVAMKAISALGVSLNDLGIKIRLVSKIDSQTGGARGAFNASDKSILLSEQAIKNEDQLFRTLAHEVGHAFDNSLASQGSKFASREADSPFNKIGTEYNSQNREKVNLTYSRASESYKTDPAEGFARAFTDDAVRAASDPKHQSLLKQKYFAPKEEDIFANFHSATSSRDRVDALTGRNPLGDKVRQMAALRAAGKFGNPGDDASQERAQDILTKLVESVSSGKFKFNQEDPEANLLGYVDKFFRTATSAGARTDARQRSGSTLPEGRKFSVNQIPGLFDELKGLQAGTLSSNAASPVASAILKRANKSGTRITEDLEFFKKGDVVTRLASEIKKVVPTSALKEGHDNFISNSANVPSGIGPAVSPQDHIDAIDELRNLSTQDFIGKVGGAKARTTLLSNLPEGPLKDAFAEQHKAAKTFENKKKAVKRAVVSAQPVNVGSLNIQDPAAQTVPVVPTQTAFGGGGAKKPPSNVTVAPAAPEPDDSNKKPSPTLPIFTGAPTRKPRTAAVEQFGPPTPSSAVFEQLRLQQANDRLKLLTPGFNPFNAPVNPPSPAASQQSQLQQANDQLKLVTPGFQPHVPYAFTASQPSNVDDDHLNTPRFNYVQGLTKQGTFDQQRLTNRDGESIVQERITKQLGQEIQSRGGRDRLSIETQDALKSKATKEQYDRTLRELIAVEQKNIEVLYKGISSAESYKIAKEKATLALSAEARDRNIEIVTDRKGAITGTNTTLSQIAQVNPGFNPSSNVGFFQNARNAFSGNPVSGSGRFSKFVNSSNATALGIAGSFALPVVADQIAQSAGGAKDAVTTGNTGRFKAAQAASSGVSFGLGGAFVGAQVGATFGASGGPIGAAVGAVVGASLGIASALSNAAREIQDVKIENALTGFQEGLSRIANVTGQLTGGDINDVKSKLSEQRSLSTEKNRSASTSFFTGFDERGFDSRQRSSTRQDLGGQLPQLTSILANQAERIGKANNGVGKNLEQLSSELASGNNGLNRELLRIVASIRGISIAQVLKELEKNIKAGADAAKFKDDSRKSDKSASDTIGAFGRLVSSVEAASHAVNKFREQATLAVDLFHGNATAGKVDSGSERFNNFGRNDPGLKTTLATIKSVGGDQGAKLEAFGNVVDKVSSALPNILSEAAAKNVDGAAVGDTVRAELTKSLGYEPGKAPKEVGQVIDQLVDKLNKDIGDKPGGLKDAVGIDVTGFSDKILAPLTGPLRDAGQKIAKQLEDNANKFSEGLAQYTALLQETRELRVRGATAGLNADVVRAGFAAQRRGEDNSFGLNSISLKQLENPQNVRLQQLLKNTPLFPDERSNPKAIGEELRSTNLNVEKAQENLQKQFETDPSSKETKAAAEQLRNLKENSAGLVAALKQLSDGASQAAAAQQKLGHLEGERTNRRGVAEGFYSSSAQDRQQVARGVLLTRQAHAQGSLDGFSVGNQQLILQTLNKFQGVTLKGLKDEEGNALTGGAVKNRLLEKSGGGVFALDASQKSELQSLQETIQTHFDNATKANEELTKHQESQSDKFYNRLAAAHEAFFARLSGELTKDKEDDQKRELGRKQVELTDAAAGVKKADVLKAAGITDKNLRDVAKPDVVAQLEKAQGAQASVEDFKSKYKSVTKAVSGVDLSKVFEDPRGAGHPSTVKVDTSSVKSQFENIEGLSDEEKDKLHARFQVRLRDSFVDTTRARLGNPETPQEQAARRQDVLSKSVSEVVSGSVGSDGLLKNKQSDYGIALEERNKSLKGLQSHGLSVDKFNSGQLGELGAALKHFSEAGRSIEGTNKEFNELKSTVEKLKGEVGGAAPAASEGAKPQAPGVPVSATPAQLSDRPLNVANPRPQETYVNAQIGASGQFSAATGQVAISQTHEEMSKVPARTAAQLELIRQRSTARVRTPEELALIKQRSTVPAPRVRTPEELALIKERSTVPKRTPEQLALIRERSTVRKLTPEEALANAERARGTGVPLTPELRAQRIADRRAQQEAHAAQFPKSQIAKQLAAQKAKAQPKAREFDFSRVNAVEFNNVGAAARFEDPRAPFGNGRPGFTDQARFAGQSAQSRLDLNRRKASESSRYQDSLNKRFKSRYGILGQPSASVQAPDAAPGDKIGSFSPPQVVTPPEAVATNDPTARIGRTAEVTRNQQVKTGTNTASQNDLSKLTTGFASFNASVKLLSDGFTSFASTAKSLSEALAAIPESIKLEGQQEVVIHHNGADVMAQLEPVIKTWIEEGTSRQIANIMKEHFPDVAPPLG